MRFPGTLDEALAGWMAGQQGALAAAAQDLSARYRKGASSTGVSLAAYVAARVPATFAANMRVHEALAAALPDFAPQSLLDIGTGPGTASWAAVDAWPSLAQVTQCEQDAPFSALAQGLNKASGLDALAQARLLQVAEKDLPADTVADLVVASYMLAELPVETMPFVAQRLWARTAQVLVLIEPGTPQGFARLKLARETLLKRGAHVLAPCTHNAPCPMLDAMHSGDWCHFKVRVQRARDHMHAKQATVPFEDEAFSYLVVGRPPSALRAAPPTSWGSAKVVEGEAAHPPSALLGEVADLSTEALAKVEGRRVARVVAPVSINKVAATLRLCVDGAVRETVIASRDKPAYKRAKKARWGDVWE